MKQSVLEVNTGFLVFLDNVLINDFVKDYTVNLPTDGSIGTCSINMVYAPDFDRVIHEESKSFNETVTDKTTTTEPEKPKVDTSYRAKNWNGQVYNVNSHLNVRSGPGTNHKIIGKMYNGGWVRVHRREGDFYFTTYRLYSGGDKDGWVSTKYIKTNKLPDSAAPVSTGSSNGKERVVSTGVKLKSDDGVENMTNIRIFSKNVFSGKYVQIFEGNVRSKAMSISNGERIFSIQGYDYMNWLQRTICPIAIPWDGAITNSDVIKWKGQGIDITKVKTVQTSADINFKGKTISEVWETLSNQTISANKLYSHKDTVAAFDKPLDRISIMGDIDENLRKTSVLDFLLTTSATSVQSVYVLLNDILNTLMFEFFQDRDGVIRVKPPFWNEHVLSNHVIDMSMILSFSENTNYDSYYTRVIASGSIEKWQENIDSNIVKAMITPTVVITSSGLTDNSGPIQVTSEADSTPSSEFNGSSRSSAGDKVCSIARSYIGWPYVWGGESPGEGGFDCSGLCQWAYKQAGYNLSRTTYTQIKEGTKITRKSDLVPGDLIFSNFKSGKPEHVVMYSGNGKVIEAYKTGYPIRETTKWNWVGEARRTLPVNSVKNSRNFNEGDYTHRNKPNNIGSDRLLEPTYKEKKFGPLIKETTQPLIKFSNATSTGSKDAYDALTRYAKFLLNFLNSANTLASITTVSMPWLRPGFNVWIDPVVTDKIYYINSITHSGNPNMCTTSLNLVLGRDRHTFINDKDSLGALKPGQSDDIFVNKLIVKPEHFGKPCNYSDVKSKLDSLYSGVGVRDVKAIQSSEYISSLYSDISYQTKYTHAETTITTTTGRDKNYREKNWNGQVYNVNSHLNVRSGPGTNHKIIGKMYNGGWVKVHRKENGFYFTTYRLYSGGDKDGWVSAKYINTKPIEESGTSTVTSKSTNYNAYSKSDASLSSDYSISEIQSKLNTIYGSANSIVKKRSERLKGIVDNSKKILNLLTY